MNPQALIIGEPATGKGFAKSLDDQIMCAMREQDEEVRAQETRYKQEQKKRGTSSKAQKQDALVEPEGMIRYLPTKTSNNIFFRRLKRAKEVVDGEVMPMHLYMFDSELDSSISAQSGGATLSNHLTGSPVDIRCIGIEQALRYAAILLDISDLNNEDFDELLIEQKSHVIWIHFAVKPSCIRRRTNFKR